MTDAKKKYTREEVQDYANWCRGGESPDSHAVKIATMLDQLAARLAEDEKEAFFDSMRTEAAKRERDRAVTPEYLAFLQEQAKHGNDANGGNEIWNAAWKAAKAADGASKPIVWVCGTYLQQAIENGYGLAISESGDSYFDTPLYTRSKP